MTKTLNSYVIFTFIVFFGLLTIVFYILQVGALSKDIYTVRNYEEKLTDLLAGNKNLDIDFAKMNSLVKINDYLGNRNFVKSNHVKYIQILEGSVAAK